MLKSGTSLYEFVAEIYSTRDNSAGIEEEHEKYLGTSCSLLSTGKASVQLHGCYKSAACSHVSQNRLPLARDNGLEWTWMNLSSFIACEWTWVRLLLGRLTFSERCPCSKYIGKFTMSWPRFSSHSSAYGNKMILTKRAWGDCWCDHLFSVGMKIEYSLSDIAW